MKELTIELNKFNNEQLALVAIIALAILKERDIKNKEDKKENN